MPRSPSHRPARDDSAPVPDEDLMRRHGATPDPAAFAELVRRYQPPLTAYLRRLVRDAASVEDLVQTTFEHLHDHRADYDAGRPLRPWLYSIATHLAIDWLRQAKRHPAVSLERTVGRRDTESSPRALADLIAGRTAAPHALAAGHERRDWARHAMEDLPEHLRATLLLIYFQGLKYTDAADVLGIPVGTVKSRVHQALQRMRLAWARESPAAAVDSEPQSLPEENSVAVTPSRP